MSSQLCWRCRKSTNSGCSWSRELKPVEGWTAESKPYLVPVDSKKGTFREDGTFAITACPEFEQDGDESPLVKMLGEWAVERCLLCYSRLLCEENGPICKSKGEAI